MDCLHYLCIVFCLCEALFDCCGLFAWLLFVRFVSVVFVDGIFVGVGYLFCLRWVWFEMLDY